MGDSDNTLLRPDFNGSLRIEGRPDRLTSFAGIPLLRELDEKLGVTDALVARLDDLRDPARTQHSLSSLLRSWLYTMAATRSTETATSELRFDPALRIAASDRRGLSALDEEGVLASQPTFSRLLATLASPRNLPCLEDALFDSAARAVHAMNAGQKLPPITLDIDSFPHRVHGHQPGSERNGHYKMRCFHPLGVMLGETGHWLGLRNRPGNVHTADGAAEMLLPLIDRAEREISSVADVRGDAGYVGPELLDGLDERNVRFIFRLPTNEILARIAEPFARRPLGRPTKEPRTWCYELVYQAGTWKRPRRVILVVQERPDELYLHTFFIVTSFDKSVLNADQALDYYRERGTMEGHIGEHQSVINGFLSSTNRRKSQIKNGPVQEHSEPIDAVSANAACLCLHGLAYNLLNTLRLLAGHSGKIMAVEDPARLHMRRARGLLLAVAGRIVVSGRRATLIVTEKAAAIWGRLWKALRRIEPVPAVL